MERVFKREGFFIYKIIPCLIITMFAFMCFYGSNVFAYTNSEDICINYLVDSKGIPRNHICCAVSHDNEIYIIAYPSAYGRLQNIDRIEIREDSQNIRVYFYTSSSDNIQYAVATTYYFVNNSFVSSSMGGDLSGKFVNYVISNTSSISSDVPIKLYNSDTDTYDDFFPLPPAKTIIAEKLEGVETEKTIQEILGIIPIVIVILVSCLALRKALKTLFQVLHQS